MKTTTRLLSSSILVVAVLAVSGALAAAANLELRPGEYALTITYEVQDQRQNQSSTATRCIRAGDLANPENIFNDRTEPLAKKGEPCVVKNLRSGNGRVSYDVDCSNRSVHVQGNVSDTGFFVLRTVTPKASQGVSLKFTVRGMRTGECLATGRS